MHTVIKLLKTMTYKQIILYTILGFSFLASMFFVNHNYFFYERPIAKVIQTNLEDTTEVTDRIGNKDHLYTQEIIAELKNGQKKGKLIHLINEYSDSGA